MTDIPTITSLLERVEAAGWAHTVPTAMLSALLRALIAQKETTDV